MAKIPQEIDCDRLLFVEGASDSILYRALLAHLGRLDGVFVRSFDGKRKLLKRSLLKDALRGDRLSSKKAVAIMVDADDNPSGTIQSLRDSLKEVLGHDIQEGEWSDGKPRVGFFVTPDGTNPGELETLVWNIWSAKDAHSAGKESILDYLSRMEAAGWPAKSPDKARIGAFLAAAYDEDPRLGAGGREGLFDFDDPGFDRLRIFLLEFTAAPPPRP